MTDRSAQLKALAGESRLQILRLLRDPANRFARQASADPEAVGVCMTLLAEEMALSQPTVSRHVNLLRQAGFVGVTKRQQWSYCRRDEEALSEFLRWLGTDLDIE